MDDDEARDALIEKIITAASERDLRLEVEFDDQEVSVGESTLCLNGRTIVEGDQG